MSEPTNADVLQAIVGLKAHIDRRFENLDKELDEHFDHISELFAGAGTQFVEILARLDRLENKNLAEEAEKALVSLGYSGLDAKTAVVEVLKQGSPSPNVRDLIKRALKVLPY